MSNVRPAAQTPLSLPHRKLDADPMNLIAVHTTVATLQDARRIAQALVTRKLAACAQISEIESFYVWNGVLQNEPERRILFKTTADRYAAVERAIRELHPYELPAIHAVPIVQASSHYAAWLEAGSQGEQHAEGGA